MRVISDRLKAFGELIKPGRTAEVTVLELDAAALEVVEVYVATWLRNRIMHNKALKRSVTEDKIYVDVVNYTVKLNSTLFYPRLWSEDGIKTEIWTPLNQEQDILDFVYRGASELYVRVFGKAVDTSNVSFTSLAKHVADGLCVMSSSDGGLLETHHLDVFPRYEDLEKLFTNNPWLLFVYYMSRLDLFTLINNEVAQ